MICKMMAYQAALIIENVEYAPSVLRRWNLLIISSMMFCAVM